MNLSTLWRLSLIIAIVCAAAQTAAEELARDDAEEVITVRVGQILPRHLCRRALKNIEVYLNSLSRRLYELTSGRDTIPRYVVELPANWRNTECTHHIATALNTSTQHEGRLFTQTPDIMIGDLHPVLNDQRSVAVQSGGCGVPGDQLQVPFQFFTGRRYISAARLNQSLLAAAQWRYGIFPEQGMYGDPMYPDQVEMFDGLEDFNATGPVFESNTGCSSTDWINGGGLCPNDADASYNSAAMTKQNILCNEKPARQIIDEATAGRSVKSYQPPVIGFVLPSDTERIILVIDQSAAMTSQWTALLSSTFFYINNLPEGTELAVVTYTNKGAAVHLPPTRVVGGNREGLHYRIPRRNPVGNKNSAANWDDVVNSNSGKRKSLLHATDERKNSNSIVDVEENFPGACEECGLMAARQLCTNTSVILLLSSSSIPSKSRPATTSSLAPPATAAASGSSPSLSAPAETGAGDQMEGKKSDKIMKFRGMANPIIRRIVFGNPSRQLWDRLKPIYMINEDQSLLNISSQASLALASATDQFPSRKFHSQTIHTRTVTVTNGHFGTGEAGILEDIVGGFTVEAGLSSDLWVQVLWEDTTDIKVFEIESPSGQIFSFPKFDAGIVYFSLRGPRETGIWSFKIKFYPSLDLIATKRQLTGLLECWASGASHSKMSLTAWARMADSNKMESHGAPPMLVYAKLEQSNGRPIYGAKVVAHIEKPVSRKEDETSANSVVRESIVLTDNGLGYPDITKGDGIYSGYFTQFTIQPGYYSIVVEAVNNGSNTVVVAPKVAVVNASADDEFNGQNDSNDFEANTCCVGSQVLNPSGHAPTTIASEPFHLFTSALSVLVSQTIHNSPESTSRRRSDQPRIVVARRDLFPPARITDFRLANYFNNSLFVTLAWTAPGNDLTGGGPAFRYEIRSFTSRAALSQENFGEQGIAVHDSLVPSPANPGAEQRSTIGVPWANEVFYYAIVAYDKAGNRGQVSNIIEVLVDEPLTTTANPSSSGAIHQLENGEYFINMKDAGASMPFKAFVHSEQLMYIIAGVISAVLIVVVIVLTLIVRRLGGCRQTAEGCLFGSMSNINSGENKTDITSSSANQTLGSSSSSPSLPDLYQEGFDSSYYNRNSVSYISGFDLPDMLEYTLQHPQKAVAQEYKAGNNNNNIGKHGHVYHASLANVDYHQHNDRYMNMTLSDSEDKDIGGMSVAGLLQYYPAQQQHHPSVAGIPFRITNPPVHHIVNASAATVTGLSNNKPAHHGSANNQQHSPSVSPVNSTYTAGGQSSTDCSVSVSGSDHELVSGAETGLQVVTLPAQATTVPNSKAMSVSSVADIKAVSSGQPRKPSSDEWPMPAVGQTIGTGKIGRKIPPAVPNKTVHASLV